MLETKVYMHWSRVTDTVPITCIVERDWWSCVELFVYSLNHIHTSVLMMGNDNKQYRLVVFLNFVPIFWMVLLYKVLLVYSNNQ